MGLDNTDVSNGVANGTTALFEHLVMKPGKRAHRIKCNGCWAWAVNAEDVDFMVLSWTQGSTFQGRFSLKPEEVACATEVQVRDFGEKVKMTAHIRILQFQLNANHATTGHKPQGKSVDPLFVGELATGVRNWMCVVLSRVRTLDGLCPLHPIPAIDNTAPHPALLDMLTRFRETIIPGPDSPTIATRRLEIIAEHAARQQPHHGTRE